MDAWAPRGRSRLDERHPPRRCWPQGGRVTWCRDFREPHTQWGWVGVQGAWWRMVCSIARQVQRATRCVRLCRGLVDCDRCAGIRSNQGSFRARSGNPLPSQLVPGVDCTLRSPGQLMAIVSPSRWGEKVSSQSSPRQSWQMVIPIRGAESDTSVS